MIFFRFSYIKATQLPKGIIYIMIAKNLAEVIMTFFWTLSYVQHFKLQYTILNSKNPKVRM